MDVLIFLCSIFSSYDGVLICSNLSRQVSTHLVVILLNVKLILSPTAFFCTGIECS